MSSSNLSRGSPERKTARDGSPGGEIDRHSESKHHKNSRPTQVVARIAKSHCAELRVSLQTWSDGTLHCDIREATAVIPNMFFPTRAGVSFDVALLTDLVATLRGLERDLLARGMLPDGRAA